MKEVITNLPVKTPSVSLDHIEDKQLSKFTDNIMALMNLSGVDMNRATHYNTKEELEIARQQLHKSVFVVDRSIYGCLFCLPGITDFARQKAVTAMLANSWNNNSNGALNIDHEWKIIEYLVSSLQANKMINLFVDLKETRVNNTRTRKIIMQKILNSKALGLWSLKYRRKLRTIFEHVWTTKKASVIKSILSEKFEDYTLKEKRILHTYIGHYLDSKADVPLILKYISFILGNRDNNTISYPLASAFMKARKDLKDGKKIPKEVLEGIRSTYHKEIPHGQVLELTKDIMTTKQKRLVQKSAKKAGVKIEFDPMNYPMVDLYIYGFEMGWSDNIVKALKIKAEKSASVLPFYFDHIGILIDDSQSMSGSEDQKLRPMAVTLATRDLLFYTGDKATILTSSGQKSEVGQLIKPGGETDISESFLKILESDPDSIFIISDGYENAPAGRFAEVLMLVRKIGCTVPIYHINPVGAAESKVAMRQLDKDISPLPISNPQTIGLTLFKAMLETDPKSGLISLIGLALPMIEKSKEVTT